VRREESSRAAPLGRVVGKLTLHRQRAAAGGTLTGPPYLPVSSPGKQR
jgi:hypothetical protein